MKILKLILHYRGMDYTRELSGQLPDAIIIDAMGDFESTTHEVYKIENKGFAANWNTAVRYVFNRDWDFVWLANNDIKLLNDDFFEQAAISLTKHPFVKIATGCFVTDYPGCSCHEPNEVQIVSSVEFTAPFIHREIFERCGYFDETKWGFGIDMLFCDYTYKLCYQVATLKNSRFLHYEHITMKEEGRSIPDYINEGTEEYMRLILPKATSTNRLDVINRVIAKRGFKDYLEIGYGDGQNFHNVACENKTVVDPFVSHHSVIKKFSHDYLLECIADGNKFDCIFIDGNHTEEAVYYDTILSLRVLKPGGCIMFHDVNPFDEWLVRPKELFDGKTAWCGTAYKGYLQAVIDNDCHHFTLADDYGIGVIDTKKKKLNVIKRPLSWVEFCINRSKLLNLIIPNRIEDELN